jgi:hypothetical protein
MDSKPTVGHSRPIPFSARAEVRYQIHEMLRDEILETSDSSFLNPLTIVYKENKQPRMCLDARKINSIMVPDRYRAPPLEETLQLFHGARHMTRLDLSSAFLQTPLDNES